MFREDIPLRKYNSFEILRALYERLNKILEEGMQRKHIMMDTTPDRRMSTWEPPIDVYENDESYIIEVELAGAKKEDISVEIAGTELRIQGIRDIESSYPAGEYHRIEIPRGVFERIIVLPDNVEQTNISARFDKGLLVVTVPKKKKSGRKVPVVEEDEEQNHDKA